VHAIGEGETKLIGDKGAVGIDDEPAP